jgi:Ras-related protein Rab-32
MALINKKICIVGDMLSGKTSFIKRCVNNTFNANYKQTIGVDFGFKEIDNLGLQLWDISGAEINGKMLNNYFAGLTCAFVILDLSNPLQSQLTNIEKWKTHLDNAFGSPCPSILLLSKTDLIDISTINFDQYCQTNGYYKWIPISSKNSEGIETACDEVVSMIINFNL